MIGSIMQNFVEFTYRCIKYTATLMALSQKKKKPNFLFMF